MYNIYEIHLRGILNKNNFKKEYKYARHPTNRLK